MAAASELSLEAVRDFMLLKGGKVTNHDLVKHFKNSLTNPDTRVQARNEFKEIVNTVATIIRSDEGEKYLVLKKKYRTPSLQSSDSFASALTSPDINPSPSMTSLHSMADKRSISHSTSQDSLDSATSPTRQPPPYRPPPPPVVSTPPSTPVSDAPPVPPRKKSTGSNKENSPEVTGRPTTIGAEADVEESDPENKISVKECMQKFQRMASESALQKAHLPAVKKRFEKGGPDKDDDTHSVTSLDPKAREWMVKAAQSDYQALFKLASENPKLAKFKDPSSGTALHWAAKHGNVDVVKLIAGTHKVDVNCRTNGGYTALHLAMQYGHEDIFNLLKDVYGANPAIRDWSGRKPRQYLTNKDTSVSADTFRKIKARKKQSEKDSGFLRIGSLNVRVKRTTEAFSNFLGVGNADKLHKTWGSADNLPQGDARKMPPPKHAPIKKRKSKRAMDFAQPIPRPESVISTKSGGADSDSDTAAGFGTQWQATV
ncbi:ankyrin repeat domain-containing protein SOWAHC isoform X3 [Homalodisca vitripennis]|uniref:ankyrin repeat domain-containing protein SOWAHC isoform X3 n=1 Tax=Homalodisca vitripennis TaxID=197043 RepID=UPI001EEAEDF0|nr:ankyrin repeat domain-containing protein SOWAHC isoform X3 [Homalodisca vitripennis]